MLDETLLANIRIAETNFVRAPNARVELIGTR